MRVNAATSSQQRMQQNPDRIAADHLQQRSAATTSQRSTIGVTTPGGATTYSSSTSSRPSRGAHAQTLSVAGQGSSAAGSTSGGTTNTSAPPTMPRSRDHGHGNPQRLSSNGNIDSPIAGPPASSSTASITTSSTAATSSAPGSSALSRQKWDKMISKGLTQAFLDENRETFLRRVRRGIPPEYRWTVWSSVMKEQKFGIWPGTNSNGNGTTGVGAAAGGTQPGSPSANINKSAGTRSPAPGGAGGSTLSSSTAAGTSRGGAMSSSFSPGSRTAGPLGMSSMDKESRTSTYQNLVSKDNRWISLIKIDISRTFPETEKFDDSHQNKLLRILSAYSNFNLDVGYCQGMNFIAGLLLLVSGSNEEETFWMFVQLMELRGLKGFYKDKFPMLRVYLKAFDRLLEEQLPDLREHFRSEGVQPAVYLHQWFLTLYINCLPLQTVLVIWDVVICEGLHVLLSITLSLLKVLQSVLLKLEFEDIVKFFKTMKTGDEDCDATMIGQLLIRQSARIELSPTVMAIINQEETSDFVDFDDVFFGGEGSGEGNGAKGKNEPAELSWFEKMGKDLQSFFQESAEKDIPP